MGFGVNDPNQGLRGETPNGSLFAPIREVADGR